MPLGMTKVAYGAQSLDEVRGWFAEGGRRGAGEVTQLTTRDLPTRHAEMIGGSVYWILKHQLVARSEIVGFGEAEGGRVAIHISTRLVEVQPRPRRAHQGWRYLEESDAPAPGSDDGTGLGMLPPRLYGKLASLALV